MYLMKFSAVRWCWEYALIARLAPPSELDPVPFRPGSAAMPNFPYTLFRGPGRDRAAYTSGQLSRNRNWPASNAFWADSSS
jgi:hypothetical protein